MSWAVLAALALGTLLGWLANEAWRREQEEQREAERRAWARACERDEEAAQAWGPSGDLFGYPERPEIRA